MDIERLKQSLSDYHLDNVREETNEDERNVLLSYIWAAILISFGFWIIDAVIGFFWIYEGTFLDIFLFNVPHVALYFRLVVGALVMGGGVALGIINERAEVLKRSLAISAKWFSATMRSVGVGLIATDRNGDIVFMNPMAERMVGITLEQAIGKSITEVCLINSQHNAKRNIIRQLGVAIRSGGELDIQSCILKPLDRGGRLPVAGRLTPIRDAELQQVGCVLALHDLSNLKRIEEEKERLFTVVEQADDAVMMAHKSGAMVYMNPACCALLSVDTEDVQNMHVRDLQRMLVDEGKLTTIMNALRNGDSWRGELQILRPTGDPLPLNTILTPVRDGTGRVTGYACISRDVSRERELQMQLLQAKKLEAVGVFAGGICHDFNNILSAILSYTGLLLSSSRPGGAIHEFVGHIEEAAEKGRGLTQQLLDFCRKKPASSQLLDTNKVLEEMVQMMSCLLGDDVYLELDLAPDAGMINVSPTQFHQAIVNLCVNARDAMKKGGSVYIETHRIDNNVQIRFTDTGAGMDEETKEHIFEPFFTTKELGGGTGLGLAIVYAFVKQSDAWIQVESNPGKGTTFVMTIPRTEESQTKDSEPSEEVLPNEECQGTILIVEDEEIVRAALAKVLRSLGLQVVTAGDCDAALTAFEMNQVDLLLTDVVMPFMNGPALAARLREERPDLPVLFMTGQADHPAHEKITEDKITKLLEKPLAPADIYKAISMLLAAAGTQHDDRVEIP